MTQPILTRPYSILANGGKQAQVVKGEPQDLVVVYDGPITRELKHYCGQKPFTTIFLASDVQSVIKKGVFDILKPNWIDDSVALGQKAPLTKK